MDNGRIINYTEKENTFGPMAGDTSVTTKWTRSMVTALIFGQMEKHMRVIGKMVNNTERPNLPTRKEGARLEYGIMAKELSG